MVRLISFFLVVSALYPCGAEAKLPTKPENVLPYLEEVYKDGDINAYANLLARNYRYVLEDLGRTWDAAAEVKGTRKLFERASAELSFSGDVSPKRASQPRTWFIDDVVGDLSVTRKDDGRVFKVQNTYSFIIREENGTLKIAEWRQKLSK